MTSSFPKLLAVALFLKFKEDCTTDSDTDPKTSTAGLLSVLFLIFKRRQSQTDQLQSHTLLALPLQLLWTLVHVWKMVEACSLPIISTWTMAH